MDFSKKNLFKVILAVVFLVGFIFATMNFLNAQGANGMDDIAFTLLPGNSKEAFGAAFWTNLGLMLSLLGITIYLILSVLDKEQVASYVLTAVGVLALIFFVVSIFTGADYLAGLKDAADAAKNTPVYNALKFNHFNAIVGQVLNIVVFALTPLFVGVKKVLTTNEE